MCLRVLHTIIHQSARLLGYLRQILFKINSELIFSPCFCKISKITRLFIGGTLLYLSICLRILKETPDLSHQFVLGAYITILKNIKGRIANVSTFRDLSSKILKEEQRMSEHFKRPFSVDHFGR